MSRRWVILGAGAIGGSVGALLDRAGERVAYVARGAHGSAIRDHGLTLRTPGFEMVSKQECASSVQDLTWTPNDVALVATKLNDAQDLLDQLRAMGDVPLIMLTNGLEGGRWAQERFSNWSQAMVWMPGTHLKPGEVINHAIDPAGIIDLGPSSVSDELAAALRHAGFLSEVRPDMEAWARAKLFTNVGNTAQALVKGEWTRVAKAAKQEAAAVLDASSPKPIDQETFGARVAPLKISDVAGRPRDGGSTWQSMQRGKPLESEFLEGLIVRMGVETGIETPVNLALLEAARARRICTPEELLG